MKSTTDYLAIARRVMDLEIQALNTLRDGLDQSFVRAIEMMGETLWRGNKLIMMGVGKSGHIASKIAATLSSTGAPCVVLDALDALHGDMGIVSSGDLVFFLSYSGRTEDLLRVVPCIKRLGAKTIGISGNAESELAQNVDLHLDIHVRQEACPLNLAPTTSTTAMLLLGDALAMVLLEARGFDKEDFAKFHPGGALGKYLLLKVDDIMRPLEQVAVCHQDASVAEALHIISEKRCGAIVVVDDEGRLLGIYTHGDFARGYQHNLQIGLSKISEVMTKNPIVVSSNKLAVEVLNILEGRAIDDLVVVDGEHKPVGMIDVADLTKHKLI